MKIKRLAPEWYRLDHPNSSYYADIQKVDYRFWQGSVREKNTNTEVAHTEFFSRLADVRQEAERLVADLAQSEEGPGN
jgi:hypothetical protein